MERYGLIGFPLSHSFSPAYFAEKFRREQIHGVSYDLFPLEKIEDLQDLLAATPGLRGFNVTIPYKESIIPMLDRLDERAQAIGAVNCVRIGTDGSLQGYNTDAWGFEASVRPFLENNFERALVLGSGGAARAVRYVLSRWGIEHYTVSRHPSGPRSIRYDELSPESLAHFPLIVNTTPLGMFPHTDERPPLPYEALTARHLLIDLIYNPPVTAFLQAGIDAGARTMNGQRMLELQAEKSWEIWNM